MACSPVKIRNLWLLYILLFQRHSSGFSIHLNKDKRMKNYRTNRVFFVPVRTAKLTLTNTPVGVSLRLGFPYTVKKWMVKYVLLCLHFIDKKCVRTRSSRRRVGSESATYSRSADWISFSYIPVASQCISLLKPSIYWHQWGWFEQFFSVLRN